MIGEVVRFDNKLTDWFKLYSLEVTELDKDYHSISSTINYLTNEPKEHYFREQHEDWSGYSYFFDSKCIFDKPKKYDNHIWSTLQDLNKGVWYINALLKFLISEEVIKGGEGIENYALGFSLRFGRKLFIVEVDVNDDKSTGTFYVNDGEVRIPFYSELEFLRLTICKVLPLEVAIDGDTYSFRVVLPKISNRPLPSKNHDGGKALDIVKEFYLDYDNSNQQSVNNVMMKGFLNV